MANRKLNVEGLMRASVLSLEYRTDPVTWVLKKGCAESEVGGYGYRSAEEFLAKMKLSCCLERGGRFVAEEADQSFDVLRGRSQEELLANKL